MQLAKQKINDMASTAKEKMVICQAKADGKAEKAMARTKEEKEIAHERRKAKEAEAKMDMHISKAAHAEDKLMAKQSHYHLPQGHLSHDHATPIPAPTPAAPVMGQGYAHNPPHGVNSVPPGAYPPASVPPGAYPPASVPPGTYPPTTGQHHNHHHY